MLFIQSPDVGSKLGYFRCGIESYMRPLLSSLSNSLWRTCTSHRDIGPRSPDSFFSAVFLPTNERFFPAREWDTSRCSRDFPWGLMLSARFIASIIVPFIWLIRRSLNRRTGSSLEFVDSSTVPMPFESVSRLDPLVVLFWWSLRKKSSHTNSKQPALNSNNSTRQNI